MAARTKAGTFRKGQSGNPGGRPKLIGHVRELAQAYTEGAIRTLAEIMLNVKANPTSRAMAAQALLDRGWGKPSQQIDHTGKLSLEQLIAGAEKPE